jgi:hypothetical protein
MAFLFLAAKLHTARQVWAKFYQYKANIKQKRASIFIEARKKLEVSSGLEPL